MEVPGLQVIKHGTTQYSIVTTNSDTAEAPGRICILQNELIKHEVNAYKTEITMETILKWHKDTANSTVTSQELLKEIRNCLMGHLDYTFDIQNRKIPELILSTKNASRRLGIAKLITISTSEAIATLTNASLLAAEEGSNKVSATDAKVQELSRAKLQLESAYNALIVQKCKQEDEMYRAFAKCINAKKQQLQLLMGGGGGGVDTDTYDVDTEVEDELNEGATGRSKLNVKRNLALSLFPSSQTKKQPVSVSPQPQLVNTDDDVTDFEEDFVPTSANKQTVHAMDSKPQNKVQKTVEPSSGSETDFEPDSPSILPDPEVVPKKRRRILSDSQDSD